MHLFFEDVNLEVTEQDDLANSWKETDHGWYRFMQLFYNVPYLKVLDEVGHADTALAEEEPDTCKVESTSEQESVFGQYYPSIYFAVADI